MPDNEMKSAYTPINHTELVLSVIDKDREFWEEVKKANRVLNQFVGIAMKESHGKANPRAILQVIQELSFNYKPQE